MSVVFALTLTVVLGVAALVVDLGAATAEHRSLQTGADAAAVAVARGCVEAVVHAGMPACESQAMTTAQTYFAANTSSTVTVNHELDPPTGGLFGRVTVSGTVSQESVFTRVITDGPLDVSAEATAQWGPMTATFAAFPLVVCDGALPAPIEGERVVVVDPSDPAPPAECNGAPAGEPFGWIAPDDVANCTSNIALLPVPTPLAVGPADTPPSDPECVSAIDELFAAIASGTSAPEDRTRVLPVYNAAAGVTGVGPSYSLVAFEFTGARIAAREAHRGPTEACAAGMHCIQGRVTYYSSPTDGPIADAATATLPGIAGTTVLDTRLVD